LLEAPKHTHGFIPSALLTRQIKNLPSVESEDTGVLPQNRLTISWPLGSLPERSSTHPPQPRNSSRQG